MASLLCRFLGHDTMRTSASSRVCVRCGQKERLQNLGHVQAWVEVAVEPARSPNSR
jgi:hypothetical protein